MKNLIFELRLALSIKGLMFVNWLLPDSNFKENLSIFITYQLKSETESFKNDQVEMWKKMNNISATSEEIIKKDGVSFSEVNLPEEDCEHKLLPLGFDDDREYYLCEYCNALGTYSEGIFKILCFHK